MRLLRATHVTDIIVQKYSLAAEKEILTDPFMERMLGSHSVHFKTEPKNHTENKPNRTDFFVFMVSGFGMV